MQNSLRVTIIIVLVLIFTLVFISYSAYQLASSKLQALQPSPESDFHSQTDVSKLSYQVTSYRRIKYNSATDMVIAEVQISANDLCSIPNANCTFQRNNFSLNFEGTILKSGGPPLQPIKNFKSRQLVLSRSLTKNQTEQGQLYFTIPKTQITAFMSYDLLEIPQPTFPSSAE